MDLSPFYNLGEPGADDAPDDAVSLGDGKTKMRHGCAMIFGQAKEKIVSGCQNKNPDHTDHGLSMICPIFRCALINTGLPCADHCNANLAELGDLLQDDENCPH
ncbi:MAG: hypothetical protein OEW37_09570 [Rhodospirillaceae bacterium]|nr:hypothetical protein [Rhodospirillaceae bacterium]